ncbi:MAG: hypothetical protein AAF591_18620 [Verrucomicrobiota bacterium]
MHVVNSSDGFAFGLLGVVPLVAAILAFVYRGYLRLGYWKSYGLAILALGAGATMAVLYSQRIGSMGMPDVMTQPRRTMVAMVFFPVFLVPLLARLYRAWVMGKTTEGEKQLGADGVRAWLGVGNVIFVLGTASCGWVAMGYSFWALLMLGAMALVAYPVVRTAGANQAFDLEQGVGEKGGAAGTEKERVLRMLEEGKVQPDEAAELLSALGESAASANRAVAPWSGKQKMILMGSILVAAGFLMPWFNVDVGREMGRAMEQAMGQVNMPAQAKEMMGARFSGNQVVAGKDIGYGLGWFILAAGLGVAGFNLIPNQLTAGTRSWCTRICLGIGAALLFYLLVDTLRYVSVGVLVVVAGYVLLGLGGWPRRVPVGSLAEARS